jgi:hypothetical protein
MARAAILFAAAPETAAPAAQYPHIRECHAFARHGPKFGPPKYHSDIY